MQNTSSVKIGYFKPKLTKYNSLEYDPIKTYTIFKVTFLEGGCKTITLFPDNYFCVIPKYVHFLRTQILY